MTRRSNERDNPNGRSRVRCNGCQETLGYVRPTLVERVLRSIFDVEVVFGESGRTMLKCPKCGKLNEFKWR